MKRALLIAVVLQAGSSLAQDWGMDLTGEADAPKEGRLQILLGPGTTGAHLYVDGEDAGELPAPPRPLKPGTHKVDVKKEGFADFSKKIWIEAGKLRRLEVKLEPSGDAITPLVDVGVVGEAQVKPAPTDRPEAEAEQPDTTVALTPSSEPDYVDPDLPGGSVKREKQTGPTVWYKRWYVWAGAAAIVGAAIGGSVAIASSASKPAPTFKPTAESVCGGPCDVTLGTP